MFSLPFVAVLAEYQVVDEVDDLCSALFRGLHEVDRIAVAEEATREEEVVEVRRCRPQTLVVHCGGG